MLHIICITVMYNVIVCFYFSCRSLCELNCDSSKKHGAGILDMKFESANVLLSCGYDTAVRLWDMRTNSRLS